MLLTVKEVTSKIEKGQTLFLAGDEELLKQLPKGDWIAGTIPYFMDTKGGISTTEKIFATSPPEYIDHALIKWYNESELQNIPRDAPENGFSVIIIPATSSAHVSYAHNAPSYPDIFLKPIIGWISGVALDDLGKVSPKVFNGKDGEISDSRAIVMHITLPADKMAEIGIVNIFSQGGGDVITFDEGGFQVTDCKINGENRNFAEYMTEKQIDSKYPLVANYCGAMVNVSFQEIDETNKTVSLYAPVFKDVEYKVAAPIQDYVKDFNSSVPADMVQPAFSCNCILNYLHSELEGKRTGKLIGPITFGEVAYQLLNQTLVYVNIKEI